MKALIQVWPISRYVGKFPHGRWEFVEHFKGSEEEFQKRLLKLQEDDPANQYRLWDEDSRGGK